MPTGRTYENNFNLVARDTCIQVPANKPFLLGKDVNALQTIQDTARRGIGDALFQDGNLVAGGSISVDAVTGDVILDAALVYIGGLVHAVAAATFTIPVDRIVAVGIRIVTDTVGHETRPDLLGSVAGSSAQGEPGADRQTQLASWGWDQDGQPGDFFPVYSVDHGVVITQDAPPQISGVSEALARYDREANGHYVVTGWRVDPLGLTGTDQIFSVSEGTANIFGYKRDRFTSLRLTIPEEPDLRAHAGETHVFADAGSGTYVITPRHLPLSSVDQVSIKTEIVDEQISRGAAAGTTDALAQSSVTEIVSVVQGATTYVETTDYVLNGDEIDWSPGGVEPATGSTFDITYRYRHNVAPDAWDAATITVSGAVTGTDVIIDTTWKLPRIDTIAARRDGTVFYQKGISSAVQATPAQLPADAIRIADINNNWGLVPNVANVAIHAVHYSTIEDMQSILFDAIDLIAQNKLTTDIALREPTTKRGLFVDALHDDDLRDAGIAQTAAIVDQSLRLPIDPTIVNVSLAGAQLLPFTQEVILEQLLDTGVMLINPYQAFTPLPPRCVLDPAIYIWTETVTQWASRATATIINGFGDQSWSTASQRIERLRSSTAVAQFLRQIAVAFTIEGFGPNEALTEVLFDGIDVTPAGVTADANGQVVSSFNIPANVLAGTKEVVLSGTASVARDAFVGSGTITTEVMRQVTTVTVNRWQQQQDNNDNDQGSDPLAQTFTLRDGRHLTGLDLKFTAVGDVSNMVVVQIREVVNGVPTSTVIAEGILPGANILTDGSFTGVDFTAPAFIPADVEHALVLMTDDAVHEVAIGEIGKFDQTLGWVTAQPYTTGVLLSSANASTWTPHQGADLTFKLRAARFTATETVIDLGTHAVTDMTDFIAGLGIEAPSADTEVEVVLTRADATTVSAAPGRTVSFTEKVTENVDVKAVLRGSDIHSPTLYPAAQLIFGAQQDSGDYASRAIPCGTDTRVSVTFDQLTPGASSATPTFGDGGAPTAMTLDNTTLLGDGWEERTYLIADFDDAEGRLFIDLAGSPKDRPQVKNIRAAALDI